MGLRNRWSKTLTLGISLVASLAVRAQVNVTTWHNDLARTGANTQETALTTANVNVNNGRVEAIENQRFDVITARAMAPLNELLKLSKSLMKKDSICLFLKGKNTDMELTESKKYWTFDCEKIPSLSDSSGNVLILKNLKPKNAAPHKRR